MGNPRNFALVMEQIIDSKIIAAISAAIGCDVTTTAGCEVLAQAMEDKGRNAVSVSTLKRLFMKNISDKVTTPRISTLDCIAMQCGYSGYTQMWDAHHSPFDNSLFGIDDYIESAALVPGCAIHLKYEPRRELQLDYLGDDWYEVVDVRGSRNLQPGDRLRIGSFSMNNTLVAGDVVRNGKSLGRYEAAKQGGLKLIERIP